MNFNATLVGQAIVGSMLLATCLLLIFRNKGKEISITEIVVNAILYLVPPVGLLYTGYLSTRKSK